MKTQSGRAPSSVAHTIAAAPTEALSRCSAVIVVLSVWYACKPEGRGNRRMASLVEFTFEQAPAVPPP